MEKILENLAATAECTGQAISPTALAMMARDLREYPDAVIVKALSMLRRESKYRMTLAAIIDQIEKLTGCGIPNADEAWAMIPKDESTSAVLTDEMLQAWGISQELYDDGDRIGARMAFKDSYNRMTEQSKLAGRKPSWTLSQGWDVKGREAVIVEAVRLGRLDASHIASAGLLPDRSNTGIAAFLTRDGSTLRLATVNGDAVEDARTLTNAREKLVGLRAAIGRGL